MFEVLNKLFLKGQAIRPWNIYWKIGNIHRCDFHLLVKTLDVTVQWAETNLLRTSSKTED